MTLPPRLSKPNRIPRTTVDRQSAHRAAARPDEQAVRARGQTGAIDLNQRCSGVARLRRAVNDHRIRNRWQRRRGRDRERAGPGYIERNRIHSRVPVGIQDRLPQGAGAAVSGRRDRVGCRRRRSRRCRQRQEPAAEKRKKVLGNSDAPSRAVGDHILLCSSSFHAKSSHVTEFPMSGLERPAI